MGNAHVTRVKRSTRATRVTNAPPRKTMERWRAQTFSANADAIIVTDLEGTILDWNPAAERLYGYSREEMLGKTAAVIHLPGEHDALQRAMADSLRTHGAWSGEVTFVRRDGTTGISQTSLSPLSDEAGRRIGIFGVNRDVSAREHLERRTRNALGGVLALAEMLLLEFDQDELGGDDNAAAGDLGRLGRLAQPLAELALNALGCLHVSVVGIESDTGMLQPVARAGQYEQSERAWWERVHLKLDDYVDAQTVARLFAGDPFMLDLAHMLPAGHGIRPAGRVIVAPFQRSGRLAGVLGAAFGAPVSALAADTEELRLAGVIAGLLSLELDRERLKGEHEAARAQALALIAAAERMSTFLGIASHELRTPLTSVSANVQMAERTLKQLLQSVSLELNGASLAALQTHAAAWFARLERTHRLLENTRQQVGRMNRLVSDMLDDSRIQENQLEMRMERCDVVELAREIVREQRAAWPSRAIVLELPRGSPRPVRADRDRIGQVITNYLTNALKYAPPRNPVTVRVRASEGEVRLEVCDEGTGLSPQQRAHLFERFYRVPGIEPQSGSGMGVGLGLYICRTIIERHGGRVGVASVPGQGSTFWFTLPLDAPETESPVEADA